MRQNIFNRYKRLGILITVLIMTNSGVLFAQNFAGGTGSIEDPYQIETPTQLNEIRNYFEANFVLNNDIDLTFDTSDPAGKFWNEGKGWEPIVDTTAFSGVFDGNGFEISGLTINRYNEWSIGLFSALDNAKILKLGLVDVNIKGEGYVGGLAGYSLNSVVDRSYVVGEIEGAQRVGGLLGQSFANSISKSFTSTKVEGYSLTGGLIGTSDRDSLLNVYSAGRVIGDNSIGGLIGEVQEGNIINSYSSVDVNGSGNTVGPLIGDDSEFGVTNILNSFWNIETTPQNDGVFGIPKTTSELVQEETFTDWDYSVNGEWSIVEGESYPFFKFQNTPNTFNHPSLIIRPVTVTGIIENNSIVLDWTVPSFGSPLGYNLYRNDELINTSALISSDEFTDTEMPLFMDLEYYVKAL